MYVAHVITRLIIGGAQENTLWNVIDQMQLFGDRVTLITGPGLGPEGSLEPLAKAAGVDLEIIPEFRRNLNPWRDLNSARKLVSLLRALKPDLVHTHTSKAGIMGRWAAKRLKIPTVHTIHGASFHVGQSGVAFRAYRQLERIAGPWTDHFISVCDAMTRQYVAAKVAEPSRFTTISSGFDVEPYLHPPRSRQTVRAELGFREDDIVVGKIARLFPLKGHEYWQAALPEILRQAPRVKLLIMGDGILRQEIEANLARHGLTQAVHFTGLVPPRRIPELLHATDLVIHTSVWEGLARVLPQALIAGKPVISYDIDGASEVVLPGETGCLIPAQSVQELATAVVQLANDPALRHRLGENGRARFANQFRHETMTARIRDVYQQVLAKADRPVS